MVPNDALVVVGNDRSHFIYLYHIGKKGWTFEQDQLAPHQLEYYMNHGAEYLYSNTDIVKNNAAISALLEEPIFEESGITVYPLKRTTDS